jgi:hypothetical protein
VDGGSSKTDLPDATSGIFFAEGLDSLNERFARQADYRQQSKRAPRIKTATAFETEIDRLAEAQHAS